MSKIQTVWVYADAAERYADLIAGARRFGAVVNAVVPCESCAAELRACGPAAVYNLGLAEGEAIENYAETIASLAQGEGNLFLFDASRRSKALAAGVAAKRGAGLVNDALSLEAGDAVKATFRTYGGLAAHGGGAFSGKDPTKVDRSASYMARYAAKNVVAAGLADRCEVQLAYAIGVAHPVSVRVDTEGTGKVPDDRLAEAVSRVFDFRPAAIIDALELRRPIYQKLAAYGHVGREDLGVAWEKTDRADALRAALGL